jgi:two-component system response regulator NreC
MKTSINILMIDDHPMILEGYVDSIKKMEGSSEVYSFSIERAHSIAEAVSSLESNFKKRELHLVLLDIGLPQDLDYLSGLELGIAIRKAQAGSKIVVITAYDTYPLLQDLIKLINPEGVLIKSEMNPDILQTACKEVLEGGCYYTKTVRKFLTVGYEKPYVLDHYDKLLLYHLSLGKLNKELVAILPLSLRSIERRKNKLRDVLKLEQGCSDVQLIKGAKEAGLL